MAIYHCSISNVSRGKGSSACATLSYISAEKVYDERLDQTYSYGRTERVLEVGTLIPEQAPRSYKEASVLFNSIEKHEKAENARTAKKIVVALPREFDLSMQKEVVEEYIRENLNRNGYCATYAIHNDDDNNNPHAHILVANRQINSKGEWGNKRKMEYVLDEKGERIALLDSNGEQKKDKNGRKQWKRRSAEQNMLDQKEFLKELRASWAQVCNKRLEKAEQIDHRSYAERGIELIPQIKEDYASREMEKRGEVSERAEINRQIRKANQERLMLKQLSDLLDRAKKRIVEKLNKLKLKKEEIRLQLEEQAKVKPSELELFIREHMEKEDLYAYKGSIFKKEGGMFGKYVEKQFTGLVVKDKKLTFGVVKEENKTTDGKYKAVKACDYEEAQRIIEKIRKERGEEKPSGVILDDKRSNELSRGRSR